MRFAVLQEVNRLHDPEHDYHLLFECEKHPIPLSVQGTECHCLSELVADLELSPPSSCNTSCAGNNDQICGGSSAVTIVVAGKTGIISSHVT